MGDHQESTLITPRTQYSQTISEIEHSWALAPIFEDLKAIPFLSTGLVRASGWASLAMPVL